MSRILADKVTNYNNDGPFEAEKGIDIPLGRPLQVDGNSGLSGQYLTSTGVGLSWQTFPTLFSGSYNDLTNKPTLFSGNYNDLTNKPVTLNLNLSTPILNNQILRYNGTAWTNQNFPTIYEYSVQTTDLSTNLASVNLSNQLGQSTSVYFTGANGITVAANESNDYITITSPEVNEYNENTAKDDISEMFVNGTSTGISYTYNPVTKTINSSVTLAEQLVYNLYGFSATPNTASIALSTDSTNNGQVTLVGTNGINIGWNVGESKITFSKTDPTPYVLPAATTTTLGGVIPDANDFNIDGNGNLTVNFPASGISLTSLSIAPEPAPFGNGALSYDNTNGQFTYTPPAFSIDDLTDVSISAVPEQYALLQWKGTYWDYVSINNLGLKLDDLTEVGDLSSKSLFDVLTWNGASWIAQSVYLGNQSIHYLDDVGVGKSIDPNLTILDGSVLSWNNATEKWEIEKQKLQSFDVSGLPIDGQILQWNETTSLWDPVTLTSNGGAPISLNDLSDVVTDAAMPGDYLYYTGTTWSPAAIPAIPENLSDLIDVSNAAATNGYVLTWNSSSSQWEPAAAGASPGAGLTSRVTRSATTQSITNGSPDDISINGFKSYSLMKIQTSAAAWVTLYCDDASRIADAARLETTDPTPGSGVIAEVITTGAQTVLMTPAVMGFNNDTTPGATIYAKVVNKSGSTQTITVTLTLLQLEA